MTDPFVGTIDGIQKRLRVAGKTNLRVELKDEDRKTVLNTTTMTSTPAVTSSSTMTNGHVQRYGYRRTVLLQDFHKQRIFRSHKVKFDKVTKLKKSKKRTRSGPTTGRGSYRARPTCKNGSCKKKSSINCEYQLCKHCCLDMQVEKCRTCKQHKPTKKPKKSKTSTSEP